MANTLIIDQNVTGCVGCNIYTSSFAVGLPQLLFDAICAYFQASQEEVKLKSIRTVNDGNGEENCFAVFEHTTLKYTRLGCGVESVTGYATEENQ